MMLFDQAAEDKVLGYALKFPSLLKNPVPDDYFHHQTHLKAYQALQQLARKAGGAADIHLMLEHYSVNDAEIGGIETLMRAYSSAGDDPAACTIYVDKLRECRATRILTSLNNTLSDHLRAGLPAEDMLGRIEVSLSHVRQASANNYMYSAAQLAQMFREYLCEAEAGKRRIRGIRTLLDPKLDDVLTTLLDEALVVVAARPSVGKTSVGLEMARLLATGEGETDPLLSDLLTQNMGRDLQGPIKTGFISKEMPWDQLMRRVVGAGTEEGMAPFMQDNFSGWSLENIRAYLDSFESLPFMLDDSPDRGLRSVLNSVAYMAQQGCKVIIVDYLQLLQYDLPNARRSDTEQTDVANISGELKAAARRHKIVLIALSQLNRPQGERAEIVRPTLKSIRGSGAIEQDADVVIFLWSDQKDYRQSSRVKLIFTVEKQRGGITDEIAVLFDKKKPAFLPWTGEHDPKAIANEQVEVEPT